MEQTYFYAAFLRQIVTVLHCCYKAGLVSQILYMSYMPSDRHMNTTFAHSFIHLCKYVHPHAHTAFLSLIIKLKHVMFSRLPVMVLKSCIGPSDFRGGIFSPWNVSMYCLKQVRQSVVTFHALWQIVVQITLIIAFIVVFFSLVCYEAMPMYDKAQVF